MSDVPLNPANLVQDGTALILNYYAVLKPDEVPGNTSSTLDHPRLSVTEDVFKDDMLALKEAGATPIRITEIADLLHNGGEIEGKRFAVLFGDALDSTTRLTQFMATEKIPFTIAVPTEYIADEEHPFGKLSHVQRADVILNYTELGRKLTLPTGGNIHLTTFGDKTFFLTDFRKFMKDPARTVAEAEKALWLLALEAQTPQITDSAHPVYRKLGEETLCQLAGSTHSQVDLASQGTGHIPLLAQQAKDNPTMAEATLERSLHKLGSVARASTLVLPPEYKSSAQLRSIMHDLGVRGAFVLADASDPARAVVVKGTDPLQMPVVFAGGRIGRDGR